MSPVGELIHTSCLVFASLPTAWEDLIHRCLDFGGGFLGLMIGCASQPIIFCLLLHMVHPWGRCETDASARSKKKKEELVVPLTGRNAE